MCGRYSIAVEPTEIEERFQAQFEEPMQPRYNAAPSQRLPVILNAAPSKIIFAQWGILPAWAANLSKKGGLINVRFETLRDKKTFRADLKMRRCLVPSDGFYEWKAATGGKKVPFRITRKDGKLFAFAGLWEEETTHSGQTRRFAIITTSANELMQPIHARMPVILREENERAWLEADSTDIQGLLDVLGKPIPSASLQAFPVSSKVNAPKNDFPELIQRE